MAMKKATDNEKDEPKSLWNQEIVKPLSVSQYTKEIADAEKMILFGESNTGKTRFYLGILKYLSKRGVPKEDILMCILYPDRPTGITKLFNLIPPEYRDNILIFPINTYEELISSTATAERKLKEHFQKTGKLGWLVVELLEDAWKSVQDYYCRLAYGETLGEYFAKKRADVKAMDEDSTAYKSLTGWGDWSIIKYFHNFNWIDKIKRMPYNVVFTAEVKEEGNKDSNFYDLGYRPGGEKDNIHRVDSIIYLSHKGNQFTMRTYKLTGYSRLYSSIDITSPDKHGNEVLAYEAHRKALQRLEDRGYRTSKFEELEKAANIKPVKEEPNQPKKEKIVKSKTSESSNENADTKEESTEDEEVFTI